MRGGRANQRAQLGRAFSCAKRRECGFRHGASHGEGGRGFHECEPHTHVGLPRNNFTAFVGLWVLLAAGSALGAPGGELDAAFGENGRAFVQLANASLGMSVAQQADGKLLIGGASFTTSGGSDFAVVRLNADGTRDNSFGGSGNGVLTVDFFQGDDEAVSFAVQPDGKILLAGWAFEADYDFALVRLNRDGSLDSTFGGDGRVTLDLGGFDEQVSGMVLSNGKIVVAGFTDANGDYDLVFARFNTNGSVDTSFGVGGTTLVDTGTNHDQAFAMTQQPDGKFIACGLSTPFPYDLTNGAMLAVRANGNGSVDTSYGSNGVALAQTATLLGGARSCAALQDGSDATVLAGRDGAFDDANLALARLDASGSIDPSFGRNGQASIDLGGWESAENIVVLNDGTLAVAGVTFAATDDIFLARIDADTGVLDSTFGNGGVAVFDLGQGARSSATFIYDPHGFGLIKQLDGKLVTVGTRDFAPSAFAIARVDPDGIGNVGVPGFVETSAAVPEGSANVRLHLRRTGGSVGEVAVDYTFVDGTAQTPGDFAGVNGTVTWADGDVANKTIAIPITNDTVVEGVEDFGVTLSNTSTAGWALAATEAGITITDNDAPGGDSARLEFASTAASAIEGTSISLSVRRIGAATGAVSVAYATSSGTALAGSDFNSTNGRVSWADGDTADKTIKLSTASDTLVEGDETFTVTLSNPSAGAALGSNATATISILDDDSPTLSFTAFAARVSEGGSFGLGVARTGSSVGAVSVDYATSSGTATSGTDFSGATGTLTWADGDSATKTITINITSDTVLEGDETFTVVLSNPSAGAALGVNPTLPVTITDDDAPGGGGGGGTLDFLTPAATVSEGDTVMLSVIRNGPSVGAASVDYATSSGTAAAGSDFPNSTGTLHWGDGDSGSKTIAITTMQDTTDEGVETLTVILSSSSGATLGSNTTATVTITDDDPPANDGGGAGGSVSGGGGGSSDRLFLVGLLLIGLTRLPGKRSALR